MQTLTEAPLRAGPSRLLAAIDESLRVGRSLCCPHCGTIHHTIIFNTGAELPCANCRSLIVVPAVTAPLSNLLDNVLMLPEKV